MSPIGSVNPLAASALTRIDAPLPKTALVPSGPLPSAPADGFGNMLEGLVSTTLDKMDTSRMAAQKVLLGESENLHGAMIAMQESSIAFGLMVEVRNKLVESYQELMRMQV